MWECARSSQLACVDDELLMLAALSPPSFPQLLFYYISALSRCRVAASAALSVAVNKQNGRDKSHVCEYLAAIFYQYTYIVFI